MAITQTTAVKAPTRRELANALRALAMDAVQAANSGHPGMPMGMADIAEVLWNDFLKHNPADPRWPDRDRFVLSNGHGSMLLYGLLHLSGYPLAIEELRNFRQLGAKTAGHPEYEPDIGIETTTGPLGQGIANAVGMALAERTLAAEFNRPGFEIIDHYTYVFVGDGCLMEGVSHEACSLAGTLGLNKLICLYDDNGISIDGEVEGWFTDDTPARFRAYGWHVITDVDGHDPDALHAAMAKARKQTTGPALICCKTVIGFGAPNKQGTAATHGAPLGADEVAAARESLDWHAPPFEVPADIVGAWNATEFGRERQQQWENKLADYAVEFPQLAAEFNRRIAGKLPTNWSELADRAVATIAGNEPSVATRKASLLALNALAPALPEMIGGSADLTGSNLTYHNDSKFISREQPHGNYISYGVREFGMAAINNGISLHDGFVPYSGTFLTFSDYARNALRMAALMRIRNIFVFTHDSIGLGEDGPTHQPVEHLASLQLIPNMRVWRPCDAVETIVAWRDAIERADGPTSLVLTRQTLPHQQRTDEQLQGIRRGGYVLREPGGGDPDVILMATGSEVHLAVAAADKLAAGGHSARVVSLPCAAVFLAQDEAYQNKVLPPDISRRVAVEAGSTELWHRFLNPGGRVIGMDRFGESAPGDVLFEHFGFTADHVTQVALELIGEN